MKITGRYHERKWMQVTSILHVYWNRLQSEHNNVAKNIAGSKDPKVVCDMIGARPFVHH